MSLIVVELDENDNVIRVLGAESIDEAKVKYKVDNPVVTYYLNNGMLEYEVMRIQDKEIRDQLLNE